ncbi:MAG: hypothetical protein ACI89X_000765 [Planctomycetota bacterium]|jgi:hypothetical protein
MMPRMLRSLALAVASLVLVPASSVRAQTQPHFVLTELSGNPATQVLKVDPVTGVAQPIVGFPSDNLPPLAIGNEPVDIEGLELGSKVTRKLGELSDWIYFEDGEMVGGYTVKVLQKQAVASKKK